MNFQFAAFDILHAANLSVNPCDDFFGMKNLHFNLTMVRDKWYNFSRICLWSLGGFKPRPSLGISMEQIQWTKGRS